jgi:hypothetical protein
VHMTNQNPTLGRVGQDWANRDSPPRI